MVLVAMAVSIGGAACESGVGGTPGMAVRDRTGVTIVESSSAVRASGDAWTVEEEPRVSIGGLDVAPEYQLYDVTGALRVSDGGIVVGIRGSEELRCYDASGGCYDPARPATD